MTHGHATTAQPDPRAPVYMGLPAARYLLPRFWAALGPYVQIFGLQLALGLIFLFVDAAGNQAWWPNTSGLRDRRDGEALLFEAGLPLGLMDIG